MDCISHRNKITINSYRFAQNAVNLTCFDNHTAKFLKPLLCLPINRLRGNQWWAQIYLLPLFFPVCLFVCKMVLVEKDIFGFASQSFFDKYLFCVCIIITMYVFFCWWTDSFHPEATYETFNLVLIISCVVLHLLLLCYNGLPVYVTGTATFLRSTLRLSKLHWIQYTWLKNPGIYSYNILHAHTHTDNHPTLAITHARKSVV